MTEPMSIGERRQRNRSGPSRRTVLHVMPDLQIGGGQTIILQGIRHLDPHRFRTSSPTSIRRQRRDGGASNRPEPRSSVSTTVPRGASARSSAFAAVPRRRRDLVQTHSDVDRKFGQLAALCTGVPVVGHLHAEWMHLGRWRGPATA